MSPYWLGFVVGAVSAVIGALVEYLLARRRNPEEERLPGCMLMMTGALGFTGVVLIVIGLFLGQLGRTLSMGLGVGTGFVLSFLVLAGSWFLFLRR